MSHFKRKFVIRRGFRNKSTAEQSAESELFHLRANGSAIATRCVQIGVGAASLNSAFWWAEITRCLCCLINFAYHTRFLWIAELYCSISVAVFVELTVWYSSYAHALSKLVRRYSYILKVPFNSDNVSGIVYVWIGENSDPEDSKLAEEIANWLYDVSIM